MLTPLLGRIAHFLSTTVRKTQLATLFTLTALVGFHGTGAAQQSQASTPSSKAGDAILIMDFSNSMWGQINGVAKIDVARDIIKRNYDDWNRLTNLGLISYGHRYKNDCSDIQLISPPGELDTSLVDRFLSQAQPRGRTPLTAAIEQAADYFIATGKDANIILLTDGIESCDRDPCSSIKAMQAKGLNLTAHVIGFGVSEEEGSEISCIASVTGGRYLNANTAGSLDDAFREAIDLVQLNDEITELRTTIDELNSAVGQARTDIMELAAEKSILAGQNADMQEHINRLTRSLADCEARLAQAQEALRLTGNELQTTEGTLSATRAMLEKTQAELQMTRQALQDTRVALAEAQADRDRLWTLVGQLRAEVARLESELEASKASNTVLGQVKDGLEHENAALRGAVEEMLSVVQRGNQALISTLTIGETVINSISTGALSPTAPRQTGALLQPAAHSEPLVLKPSEPLLDASIGVTEAIELAPLSEANSPAATPMADYDRVDIVLAEGMMPMLSDLAWTIRGLDGNGTPVTSDSGTGNGFAMPKRPGVYEIAIELKPFTKRFIVEIIEGAPKVHVLNLQMARIEIDDIRADRDEPLALSFTDDTGAVVDVMVGGSDVIYLPSGMYALTIAVGQQSLTQMIVAVAGKTVVLPVQAL